MSGCDQEGNFHIQVCVYECKEMRSENQRDQRDDQRR